MPFSHDAKLQSSAVALSSFKNPNAHILPDSKTATPAISPIKIANDYKQFVQYFGNISVQGQLPFTSDHSPIFGSIIGWNMLKMCHTKTRYNPQLQKEVQASNNGYFADENKAQYRIRFRNNLDYLIKEAKQYFATAPKGETPLHVVCMQEVESPYSKYKKDRVGMSRVAIESIVGKHGYTIVAGMSVTKNKPVYLTQDSGRNGDDILVMAYDPTKVECIYTQDRLLPKSTSELIHEHASVSPVIKAFLHSYSKLFILPSFKEIVDKEKRKEKKAAAQSELEKAYSLPDLKTLLKNKKAIADQKELQTLLSHVDGLIQKKVTSGQLPSQITLWHYYNHIVGYLADTHLGDVPRLSDIQTQEKRYQAALFRHRETKNEFVVVNTHQNWSTVNLGSQPIAELVDHNNKPIAAYDAANILKYLRDKNKACAFTGDFNVFDAELFRSDDRVRENLDAVRLQNANIAVVDGKKVVDSCDHVIRNQKLLKDFKATNAVSIESQYRGLRHFIEGLHDKKKYGVNDSTPAVVVSKSRKRKR